MYQTNCFNLGYEFVSDSNLQFSKFKLLKSKNNNIKKKIFFFDLYNI